jgi:capsular exopolysaccharide synthesis family protein
MGRMWIGGSLQMSGGAVFTDELQNLFGTQVELMKSEPIRHQAHDRIAAAHPTVVEDPPEIEVFQPRRTSLFILRATGLDPEYLIDYLNAVMEKYLDYRREVRSTSSDEALAGLQAELLRQETNLITAENSLHTFASTNNAVVLQQEGVSAGSYLSRINLQLAELKLEYDLLGALSDDPATAPPRRLTLANAATPGQPSDDPAWSTVAAGARSAREQVETLKLYRDELARYLKPKHPKMIRLEEEIARGEKLLEVFRAQSAEQREASRKNLRLQLDELEEAARLWEAKVLDLNRRMADYDRLKAAVTRAQSLFDRFGEMVHSLDVSKRLDRTSVSILDRARLMPGSSRVGLGVGLGGGFGFLLGLAWVALVAARDDRMRSVDDLNALFPGEVIGHIPAVRTPKRAPLAAIEPGDVRDAFIESFRALRSALLFLGPPEARPKTLLVTSAEPGEGKTTVVLNLARALAFAGSRVLLIDGNLRRGALPALLGAAPTPGLTDVVEGRAEASRAVQSDGLANLSFLPSGQPVAGAGEVFLHRRFDTFILDAVKTCDFVLIDSAPVLTTADTATLAPRVDGVLLVAREHATRTGALRRAIELLERRQANVVGLVYNAATTPGPELDRP